MPDTDDTDDASDLLDLLTTDHARIQRFIDEGAGIDTIVREITPHLVSEDQLLYREMRRQLTADDLVDDLLDLDHRLEEALAAVEEVGPEEQTAIADLFAQHVQRQEGEAFPALQAAVDQDRLNLLGDTLQEIIRTAPTRPHPHSPDEGWRQTLVDGMSAGIERFKDLWKDR